MYVLPQHAAFREDGVLTIMSRITSAWPSTCLKTVWLGGTRPTPCKVILSLASSGSRSSLRESVSLVPSVVRYTADFATAPQRGSIAIRPCRTPTGSCPSAQQVGALGQTTRRPDHDRPPSLVCCHPHPSSTPLSPQAAALPASRPAVAVRVGVAAAVAEAEAAVSTSVCQEQVRHAVPRRTMPSLALRRPCRSFGAFPTFSLDHLIHKWQARISIRPVAPAPTRLSSWTVRRPRCRSPIKA